MGIFIFSFILLGIVLYGCILLYRKTTKTILGDLVWIIALISLVLLSLGGIKEMTLPPEQRMTNGNPAFLFWVPTIFLLGFLLLHTKKIIHCLCTKLSSLARTAMLISGFVIVVYCAWLQLSFAAKLLDQLFMHKALDSAHINTVFFNKYVLFFTLGLGVVWGRLAKKDA